MDFNYAYKLPSNEVLVSLLCDDFLLDSVYASLMLNFYDTGKKYGFSCSEGISDDCQKGVYVLKHAIIISSSVDPAVLTEKCLSYLSYFDRMSLGIAYNSKKEMLAAKPIIDKLKAIHGDRINYLRPDVTSEQGMCFVSQDKILDNAVCDTVRIKYKPKQISPNIENFDASQCKFFLGVADLYMRYHLYHRSPCDGFIAARGEGGFYITATKTNKRCLTQDRISFVHSYNEKTNELMYSGKYLPSSDVVEASVLFRDHNPNLQAVVHLHASDQFTRNPNYTHKIKVGISSYGVASLGYEISHNIEESLDDFLIIEEHGEVFPLRVKGEEGVAVFEKILQKYKLQKSSAQHDNSRNKEVLVA